MYCELSIQNHIDEYPLEIVTITYFPDPDAPTSAILSPGSALRLTPSKTCADYNASQKKKTLRE